MQFACFFLATLSALLSFWVFSLMGTLRETQQTITDLQFRLRDHIEISVRRETTLQDEATYQKTRADDYLEAMNVMRTRMETQFAVMQRAREPAPRREQAPARAKFLHVGE